MLYYLKSQAIKNYLIIEKVKKPHKQTRTSLMSY